MILYSFVWPDYGWLLGLAWLFIITLVVFAIWRVTKSELLAGLSTAVLAFLGFVLEVFPLWAEFALVIAAAAYVFWFNRPTVRRVTK